MPVPSFHHFENSRYFTSSVIWLSLESFYNAGLTPEDAKEAIESIRDPGNFNRKLRCENRGLNGNWNVKTALTDPQSLDDLHYHIIFRLWLTLKEKVEGKPPQPVRSQKGCCLA